MSKHLGQWDESISLIFSRSENDVRYDWDKLVEDAAKLAYETDDLGIRFTLLFSNSFEVAWEAFAESVNAFRFEVENGAIRSTADLVDENAEHRHWAEICRLLDGVRSTKTQMYESLRAAMRQLDTE